MVSQPEQELALNWLKTVYHGRYRQEHAKPKQERRARSRRTEKEPRFVDNFADDNQLDPFSFASISTQPPALGLLFCCFGEDLPSVRA